MSYDPQPFGSIFLHDTVQVEPSNGQHKRKRRRGKKSRKREQAEAERREYDMWVVAMYKKNQNEQRQKEKEKKLRNLIEQSVIDSTKKMDLQYSNPIPPLRKKRKDKGNISKSRIQRTRGLQASGSDSMAKQTEYRRSEAPSKNTSGKDLIVGAKEAPTIKLPQASKAVKAKKARNENNTAKTTTAESPGDTSGRKTSSDGNSPQRGLPFSRAKELAEESLANEVTQLKNKFNSLKVRRLELEKILKTKTDSFRANINIESTGIQYDELSYDDALSPKPKVARLLHEILIRRVRTFLYSFYQVSPPVTMLDNLLVDVVGVSQLHLDTPERFSKLLFSGMSMNEVVNRKCRECLAALRSNAKRWESQLSFVLGREAIFKARLTKQIEDFNHHIAKNKEDIKITKSTYWDLMKQFDHLKTEASKQQQLMKKNRKVYHLLEERLLAEVKDSALWTAEIDRMSSRRERVAKMFHDDLQAKQLAREAKEQEVKQMLLKAKKEAEEKRLAPYKKAAMKIFHETGTNDVSKILESFENQEGRFENLAYLIEQKENQLEQFHQELDRLRRLLEQSKLINGGAKVSPNDDKRLGIDIYNSKLKEAVEEANKERIRAHNKFVTKRNCLIGLVSCAKKLGISVPPIQLDAKPLKKYVMPRRKRRSSIINRAPAQSSALDENKIRKEKEQISLMLKQVEEKMKTLMETTIANLKAANEGEKENMMGQVVALSKSNSNISSRSGSVSRASILKEDESSSQTMNDENLKVQNSKERLQDGSSSFKVSEADLMLIEERIKELPFRKSELNVRIKKRNVIVSEYVDQTGKLQYAYTYLSDDEDDDDPNNNLDYEERSVDIDSSPLGKAKALHIRFAHLMHEEHTHDLNDDWKEARENQRLQSQSITNIYEKKSPVSDLDSSQLIAQSQILDQEFENLDSQANYTKEMQHQKEVNSMSKAARRQTNKWREKMDAQKKLQAITGTKRTGQRSKFREAFGL